MALVDIIANGRLDVGVGRGNRPAEFAGYRVPQIESRDRFDEVVEVLRLAWTQERFAFHGRFFDFDDVRVIPKPLQQPHPPLWAATTSAPSHERIGRLGLGLLSFTIGVPPEELAQRIALYRRGLTEARPIGRFVNARAATFTMVHVADTTQEAVADARESFAWYAQTGVRQIQTLARWQVERQRDYATYEYVKPLAGMDPGVLSFDYLDSIGACLVGDPERVIATARRYAAAGCDLLLCLAQPRAIPHAKVLRSLELLGEQVIPALA
jgi:alkanesulfonate monooxygenase SsuD/methylene tetrahydromethanopterin reductase-like flavin-dependent oxidoreductase (luciferase family)